ncbi:MAG: AsmA family protein [Proteobacteria bacterium]|nr:AsmA family protein [Pseudomonadota bacterium]
MGRLIKFLAWLVAAAISLFAVAAIAVYLFFDPNDFREDIAWAVKTSIGRELIIEGDISLDLFPSIAIDVGSTSLGNAPGFGDEPMVRFERARLRVKLMPLLLRQEIEVGTAEIDSLVLNLQTDARGLGNWEDLVSAQEQDSTDDETQTQTAIDIAGLEIRHATIRYRDAGSGDDYTLTETFLSLGRVSGTDTLNIAGLSIEGTLNGVADAPSLFKLQTDGVEIRTADQVVHIQPLQLTAFGVDMSAQIEPLSYANDVEVSATIQIAAFSPKSLMQAFGVASPQTADPTALSSVSIDAQAKFTAASIELTNLRISLDDTTLTGSLSVPRSSSGSYRFDLVVDAIDLDRYMEPGAAPAATGEAAPVEIPVDLIRSLHARGKLRVTTATSAGLVFENVELGLNAAAGRMRIYPIKADFYDGSYDGDVKIDVAAPTPVISFNEKIDSVNVAGLAKALFDAENITGTMNGTFNLTGRGDDTEQMLRSLSGKMSIELKDGTFEGTDVWYELRRARALIKGLEAPQPVLPPRTRFSSVSATGVVTGGVMRNNDLFVELPFMQLKGAGQVDLVAATVAYDLVARVFARPELLQDVTEDELKDFTRAEIPLKVSGSLMSPSIKPDVGKLLRKQVEEKIKDELMERLKGLFNK